MAKKIEIRFSDEEILGYRLHANAHGLDLSAWVREAMATHKRSQDLSERLQRMRSEMDKVRFVIVSGQDELADTDPSSTDTPSAERPDKPQENEG